MVLSTGLCVYVFVFVLNTVESDTFCSVLSMDILSGFSLLKCGNANSLVIFNLCRSDVRSVSSYLTVNEYFVSQCDFFKIYFIIICLQLSLS